MKKNKVIDLMDNLIEPIPDYPIVWRMIAKNFPSHGKVGISYLKSNFDSTKYTESFLYRDSEGKLIGIFEYFPVEGIPKEKKGGANLLVAPNIIGKGIGKELLTRGLKIWDIDFEQQEYTPLGYKLIRSYLRSNGYKFNEHEKIESFLNHFISNS